MATAEQLEKIAKLADLLVPLARKQRGMPIEADDWNTLVTTMRGILDIDRVQEQTSRAALDEGYAPRVHEHLGTVDFAWLAADLQAELDKTGGATVATALGDMARRLKSAQAEVVELTDEVAKLRRRIDDLAVSDVDRMNRLRKFETDLAGLTDLKVTVGRVATDVGTLTPRIADVLALDALLTDETGQPIDLPKLQRQIVEVQALNENFTGLDGEVLRMRDIELKIQDIASQLNQTTGGGIDTRFEELRTELDGRIVTFIDTGKTELKNEVQTEIEVLRGQTRAELQERLESARLELNQAVEAQVGDVRTSIAQDLESREQRLAEGLRAELKQSTDAQIAAGLGNVQSLIQQEVATAETRLAGNFDQRLNDRLTGIILPPIIRTGRPARPDRSGPSANAATATRTAGRSDAQTAPGTTRKKASGPKAAGAEAATSQAKKSSGAKATGAKATGAKATAAKAPAAKAPANPSAGAGRRPGRARSGTTPGEG
jgi:hypothetical protein